MSIKKWLAADTATGRLTRTIAQGVIGVLIANIDLLTGCAAIPNELRPVVAALVMAVLAPIMKALGGGEQE